MSFVLHAKERGRLTRHELKTLRDNGNVPAIIYGRNINNIPIYVDQADFLKGIKAAGRNALLSIDVSGKQHQVIMRTYEEDALSREIIHIDFLAVNPSSLITNEVPVTLVGESLGVQEGGVLQQSLYELSISSKASDIPESIDVDITNLDIAETIYINDIRDRFPFEINHEDTEVIVSILPPKQEEVIHTGEKQSSTMPEDIEVKEESE